MPGEWLKRRPGPGMDLDGPEAVALRRRLIERKPFLRLVYEEWYRLIVDALPAPPGAALEIGAAGGFLAERVPGLITADIVFDERVSLLLDAHQLPFQDQALRAIAMTNVLHHLPRTDAFLVEAGRCVRPGGALVMYEPWVTPWSRLVYRWLHVEPFAPATPDWRFPERGPMSGANGALPWILFERDRSRLEREMPYWRIERIERSMPVAYLLSGGVTTPYAVPGWSFGAVRRVERLLSPWMGRLAMFALIVLRRV